jgi:hephaestin
MEGSSTMWMYHSHVDEAADTNAGLMGPMIVTRCGQARPDGSPIDVDRELVVNFSVMDENTSLWEETNRTALADPPVADDDGFIESNKMHSINGFVYGNLPGLTCTRRPGSLVRDGVGTRSTSRRTGTATPWCRTGCEKTSCTCRRRC